MTLHYKYSVIIKPFLSCFVAPVSEVFGEQTQCTYFDLACLENTSLVMWAESRAPSLKLKGLDWKLFDWQAF